MVAACVGSGFLGLLGFKYLCRTQEALKEPPDNPKTRVSFGLWVLRGRTCSGFLTGSPLALLRLGSRYQNPTLIIMGLLRNPALLNPRTLKP